MDLKRGNLIVGVVGAGTMGRGIAQVCAQARMTALLFDTKWKDLWPDYGE